MRLIALILLILTGMNASAAEDQESSERQGLRHHAMVRALLLDDQRIQWSGLENSFSAEAILELNYLKKIGKWQLMVQSELLVNQPFNQNILSDEFRDLYRQNFEYEIFTFRQLYIGIKSRSMTIRLGQITNPFGRCYLTASNNARSDLPFLRTEVVAPTDTGFSISFTPGIFSLDFALVNGSEGQDTTAQSLWSVAWAWGRKTGQSVFPSNISGMKVRRPIRRTMTISGSI